MIASLALAAGLLVGSGAGIDPAPTPLARAHAALAALATARPSQTIYVGEDYDAEFDARPGDVIIVIMHPTDGWIDRCDRMGGEPIWNPYTLIRECDGVDF